MANTKKKLSERDGNQALQHAHNDVNSTLGVDGFIVGKVGRKIEVITTSTTDQFDFKEDGALLYTILVTYTDSSKENILEVERTA